MSRPNQPRRCHCCFMPPHIIETMAIAAAEIRGAEPREIQEALLESAFSSSSLTSLRLARAEVLQRMPRARRRIHRIHLHFPVSTARRRVFDCGTKSQLPGSLVRREGATKTGDPAADDAYDHLGTTYDFFWRVYHRNSLDDRGLPLTASVHYRHKYDDAFWDGRAMIFGDGDTYSFQSFTTPIEVTAHELVHGVTQYEANLIYWGQPGALNESVSDVFAILTKQRSLNQKAEDSDWLLGADLFTEQFEGSAIRSMKAPGTAYDNPALGRDPQPVDMDGFVQTTKDHGGVHINSGIPNRAFYLAATKIGGYAWTRAGLIWYRTLTSRELARGARFIDFARLTVRMAGRIFGHNSIERHAVRDAWVEVRVLPAAKAASGSP